MIAISDHPEGCVLPVRAQPGARRTGVLGEQGGSLRVAVAAAREGGRANRAVVETLCEALDLKGSQVTLVRGQTSRQKHFLVRGVGKEELRARVASLFQG